MYRNDAQDIAVRKAFNELVVRMDGAMFLAEGSDTRAGHGLNGCLIPVSEHQTVISTCPD